MKETLAGLAVQALQLMSPVILLLIAWLSAKAAQWIGAHVQNTRTRAVLLRLNDAVTQAVTAIEQTAVAAAKKPNQNSKLTANAASAVKAAALDELKSHLGPKGVAEVIAVLGIDGSELDKFLSTRIEAAVYAEKQSLSFGQTAP